MANKSAKDLLVGPPLGQTGKDDVRELTADDLAAISGGTRTITMFLRRVWRDGALFGRAPAAQ
jgi:hypothetical protein